MLNQDKYLTIPVLIPALIDRTNSISTIVSTLVYVESENMYLIPVDLLSIFQSTNYNFDTIGSFENAIKLNIHLSDSIYIRARWPECQYYTGAKLFSVNNLKCRQIRWQKVTKLVSESHRILLLC